jgi:hypothetical protein
VIEPDALSPQTEVSQDAFDGLPTGSLEPTVAAPTWVFRSNRVTRKGEPVVTMCTNCDVTLTDSP